MAAQGNQEAKLAKQARTGKSSWSKPTRIETVPDWAKENQYSKSNNDLPDIDVPF
jgi:hypothetical protein